MAQLMLCLFTALVLAQDVRVLPTRTHYVAPVYSDAAKAAGAKGTVVIEATIDETGRVAEARVIRSIPLLDQAAMDAVKQWRFSATTLNGKPIRTIATVSVPFEPSAAPFDLTGTWTLVSSTLGDGIPRVDSAFGEGFTAVQTPDDLTVDSPALTTGRGGAPGRPIHVTYRFDGSVTNVNRIASMNVNANTGQVMSSGPTSMSWNTASWVGDKLQILLHEQSTGPDHISTQIELWRNADGTIEAERTINPSGGYPGKASLAWHARYRRAGK